MARYIEPNRAGEAIVWEVAQNYCRENLEVTSPAEGYAPNTVLIDENEDLIGMLVWEMEPDTTDVVAVITDGPAELFGEPMAFPILDDVAADPVAEPPVEAVDGAAATAALRTKLVGQFADRGIKVR